MTGRAARFDVVIVGARCAGAPLAALLARRGMAVAVVDQATFPRDALSSHVKQADALAFMDRLGVLDEVRATGAPFTSRIDGMLEDFRVIADIPRREGDVGGGACIRRRLLDQILVNAAAEAGAEVRTGARVLDLLEDGGRATGVQVAEQGSTTRLRAPLVVGADGRASTVASLCGARKYSVVPNQRAYYWSYFEGATLASPPTFVFHRWGDRFVISNPADSGLYMVGVSPEATERDLFRRRLERSFMDHAWSCEPIAAALEGARRATKIYGILRFEGYFREATGPGWVLVGDAGHFKDPAAGRGIGDAFLQVEALERAIVQGLDGSGDALDETLRRWGRWRDREFAEHYWLGVDLGLAGRIPETLPEIVRRVCEGGETDRFVELLSHRARPAEVLSLGRALGAAGRLLPRRTRGTRRALLGELGTLAAREARRRWANAHPTFVSTPARPGQHRRDAYRHVPVSRDRAARKGAASISVS